MSEDTGADVVIELDRRTTNAAYRTGDTLLQTARSAGPEWLLAPGARP